VSQCLLRYTAAAVTRTGATVSVCARTSRLSHDESSSRVLLSLRPAWPQPSSAGNALRDDGLGALVTQRCSRHARRMAGFAS